MIKQKKKVNNKKIMKVFLGMALCIGLMGGPMAYAQEQEEEAVVEISEVIEVEGENYGHISVNYAVPEYDEESAQLTGGEIGLNGSGDIPAAYDSRTKGYITAVKNQGTYGTCWTFAAMNAAESDAIMDNRNTNPDYSELQLAYFTYNRVADPLGGTTGDKIIVADGDYLNVGGNGYFSTIALASWISPANEDVMKYEDASTYASAESVDAAFDYEANVAHLQNAYWVSISDTDSVKQLIMDYGCVDTSLYYDTYFLKSITVDNVTDWYFYNPVDNFQNHEISLVGWNDNIPATNFTRTVEYEDGTSQSYTPETNGGWLVKNSHGTSSANGGYFWVSYSDLSLNYQDTYRNTVVAYDFEPTDNYDYNYQYDGSCGIMELSSAQGGDTIYGANVFTVQNGSQELDAVGFYTTNTNMKYSIQIYKVTEDNAPIGEALLTTPVEGYKAYIGYHTVKLNEKVVLQEGDKFSVVIKYTDTHPLLTGATIFADVSYSNSYMSFVSAFESGQGYYGTDGSDWIDCADIQYNVGTVSNPIIKTGLNLRIKAFTNSIPVESVALSEEECTIGVGDEKKLTVDFTPSYATNQKVTWSSDDEAIVTVDENGTITGVKVGIAVVTVTTVDGEYTDSCMVKVMDKYDTPDAPVLSSRMETSITVKEIEGCQYSLDGNVWQDSNEFTGLNPGTEYKIYAKVPGDDNYYESDVSQPLVVSTYSLISSISLNHTSVTLVIEEDDSVQLTATVNPSDIRIKTLVWESQDESVAVVDANGLVTAKSVGETDIVVKAEGDTEKYATCHVTVSEKPFEAPEIDVLYRTHIQTFGWEGNVNDTKTWRSNGQMSGTSGLARRLEGINIVVAPATVSDELDLGIQYTTHCQTYGWLPWSADGDMNGTEGESKRLEAIMIKLTGEHAEYYDVYYRVHAQTFGWLGWAKNGQAAGTAGLGRRLEGIQIVVVKKGETFNQNMESITSRYSEPYIANAGASPVYGQVATDALNPSVAGETTPNVAYRTHVQSLGWQGFRYNGQMSGTSGLSRRLEGIEIKLTNKDYEGGIAYTTHIQSYGWQRKVDDPSSWMVDGQMSGTSGESKRLEAICIKLTGEMENHYDIYYRVHAQSFGWLGWAKNGEEAGTSGLGRRLEGIQIVLVPKGEPAPTVYAGITSKDSRAYIEK